MADEMHESIHPDRMWINIENRLVIPLQCPTSISAKEVFFLEMDLANQRFLAT